MEPKEVTLGLWVTSAHILPSSSWLNRNMHPLCVGWSSSSPSLPFVADEINRKDDELHTSKDYDGIPKTVTMDPSIPRTLARVGHIVHEALKQRASVLLYSNAQDDGHSKGNESYDQLPLDEGLSEAEHHTAPLAAAAAYLVVGLKLTISAAMTQLADIFGSETQGWLKAQLDGLSCYLSSSHAGASATSTLGSVRCFSSTPPPPKTILTHGSSGNAQQVERGTSHAPRRTSPTGDQPERRGNEQADSQHWASTTSGPPQPVLAESSDDLRLVVLSSPRLPQRCP